MYFCTPQIISLYLPFYFRTLKQQVLVSKAASFEYINKKAHLQADIPHFLSDNTLTILPYKIFLDRSQVGITSRKISYLFIYLVSLLGMLKYGHEVMIFIDYNQKQTRSNDSEGFAISTRV